MMDILDKKFELKRFIMRIYKDSIITGNNLKEDEYFRILRVKTDETTGDIFKKVNFFKNVDDIVDFCTSSQCARWNTYFTLATTDGESGQSDSLKKFYVLGFDFDKKDFDKGFSHKDILNRFRDIKVKYSILVDSGHGYHVYVYINETDDFKKVNEVTKAIASKIESDPNACKITQVLRPPCTFNMKSRRKMVKTIFLEDDINAKRYNIEDLYNRFCNKDVLNNNVNTKHTIVNTNLKPCIEELLNEGSKAHCNNSDLQKIVVELRHKNKSLSHVKAVAEEWNNKNEISWSNNELEYQIEKMYNNLLTVDYGCSTCEKRENCKSICFSNFEYSDNEVLLNVNETEMKHLKKTNRKGAKVMDSNDLVLYSILKNHSDGLSREDIVTELTYKDKCLFSKNTITKALKSLEENNFIVVESINKFKFYKIKEAKSKVELKYLISYSATYECVKGNISTEELKLYNLMRYLHHKEQRENPNALKGNLFQMNQADIAKELGVTQGRVSQMINSLLREKILSPYYKAKSKNNGFDFYVYRLNY